MASWWEKSAQAGDPYRASERKDGLLTSPVSVPPASAPRSQECRFGSPFHRCIGKGLCQTPDGPQGRGGALSHRRAPRLPGPWQHATLSFSGARILGELLCVSSRELALITSGNGQQESAKCLFFQ